MSCVCHLRHGVFVVIICCCRLWMENERDCQQTLSRCWSATDRRKFVTASTRVAQTSPRNVNCFWPTRVHCHLEVHIYAPLSIPWSILSILLSARYCIILPHGSAMNARITSWSLRWVCWEMNQWSSSDESFFYVVALTFKASEWRLSFIVSYPSWIFDSVEVSLLTFHSIPGCHPFQRCAAPLFINVYGLCTSWKYLTSFWS